MLVEGGREPVLRGAVSAGPGFDFWRLPLPRLEELEQASQPPRASPRGSAFGSAAFWSLPLPALGEDDELGPPDAGRSGRGTASTTTPRGEAPSESAPPSAGARPASAEPEAPGPQAAGARAAGAGAAAAPGGAPAPAPEAGAAPRRKRNLADEMAEMLDRYAAEKGTFQRNLEELLEMQARLRALTAASSMQHAVAQQAGRESGGAAEQPAGAFSLPPEIVGRTLWHLDFGSLVRAMYGCREWARLARSKVRWQCLCEADWGTKRNGSWQDYRHRLERWRVLQSTLSGLKGSGCPSGICGSFARRKLFEALEALVELGAAEDPSARYPTRVPELLRSTGACRTLMALLEDESPHLLCLAVRCLADLVNDDEARPGVRAEVVQRGELVRRLLEGDDDDIVESGARLMLNLHGGSPGVPLSTRRRGPASFAPRAAAAAAWSGVWSGEMRYARGGERHAALRLILGADGDPALEQATAAFHSALAAGAGEGDPASSSGGPRMRAECGTTEYWHYFGFLAASDFDCESETLKYVDEQIRRQREMAASPNHRPPRLAVSLLAGAGWDEQNGAFSAEAQLPLAERAPSSPQSSASPAPAAANAVPLRLTLRYESRGTYELTGFLAEGAGDAGAPSVPVLYGVWATAPSQHKHLFALRRVAPLPEAP